MPSLSFLHDQVAKTLVLYRERAELTIPAAAILLAVTEDIIRSHESGRKQYPAPGLVADWLRDYGAPQYIIDEAKEQCRVIRLGDPSRWRSKPNEWQTRLAQLERQATSIDIFEDTFVTGLCQIRAYSEAIFATNPDLTPDWKALALDYRAHRRRTVLESVENRPLLRVVQSERSLTTTQGMEFHADQMRRLVEDCRRPNFEIFVLPSGLLHPSMDGSYRVMMFSEPTTPDVAYHEGPLGGQYEATADQVTRFRDVFSATLALAVPYEEWRTERC